MSDSQPSSPPAISTNPIAGGPLPAPAPNEFEARIARLESLLGVLGTLVVPLASDVGRVVATHGAVSADTQLAADALTGFKALFENWNA